MSREQILIVDDDPAVREMLTGMVGSMGFSGKAVSSSRDVLSLIQTNHFDIIISDIRMPGGDGLQLIKEVHSTHSDVPFIIITGYSSDYDYDTVINAGADEFIKKPFTLAELEKKLKRVLHERHLSVENKRLMAEQAADRRKLKNLLEIALDLTAELDFDRLFRLIISHVTGAMETERTSLYIIDWDRHEIWTRVAEQIKQIRLPIGQGISGRVAETGETILSNDVSTLDFFSRDFDIKHGFTTKSVLCMPLYSRIGERIAVIQVMNKRNDQGFTQDDIGLLKSLGSQIEIALENSRLMEEISLSFESSIRTLSATVDARHPLTAGHSQRVTEYALLIADALSLPENEQQVLKYAGLLHDIGKIGIKDNVLMKYGKFTPEEREEMNRHPEKTRAILEKFRFPKALADVPFIAAHHHEKIDGTGYPAGFSGDEIPFASRILAVADVFDALTSLRDYPKYTREETLTTKPMSLEKALKILEEDSGTHFDPDVVAAFIQCLPQALIAYRGSHFPPEYVDDMLRSIAPELLEP